jgi:Ca2+-binding EF-hand superfamily protein
VFEEEKKKALLDKVNHEPDLTEEEISELKKQAEVLAGADNLDLIGVISIIGKMFPGQLPATKSAMIDIFKRMFKDIDKDHSGFIDVDE